jgi:hypothetical protein
MNAFESSVLVPEGIERVWQYVHDLERRVEWDSRILRAKLIHGLSPGTDCVVRYTYRGMLNTSYSLDAWYQVFEPPSRCVIRFINLPRSCFVRSAAGVWKLKQTPKGTRFTSKFQYKLGLGGFGDWLDERIFRRRLVNMTEDSLARLVDRFTGRRTTA